MRPRAKTNLEKMGFVDPDRKESKHDVLQLQILENPEKLIKGITKKELKDLKIESAILEVPVLSTNSYSNSKFIVGYLDCLIVFSFDDGKEYRSETTLAIEIKTKVESFGDTLRQINTYKQYSKPRTIFVVASEDDRYKEQFESQNIRFYNFK